MSLIAWAVPKFLAVCRALGPLYHRKEMKFAHIQRGFSIAGRFTDVELTTRAVHLCSRGSSAFLQRILHGKSPPTLHSL